MVFQMPVDDVRLTCPVNFWILLLPRVQTHQGLQLTWDGLLSLEICPAQGQDSLLAGNVLCVQNNSCHSRQSLLPLGMQKA